MKISRRRFLKTSFAGATALSLSAHSWARVNGANNDIRIGAAGLGGEGGRRMGRRLAEAFGQLPGVRLVALCDVDRDVLNREQRRLGDLFGPIDAYRDVREMIDRDDIDAIVTATPNHWHAPITVWACQAGKDVYVEKPVSHNIWEGRRMVEAARKYGRMVQAGTANRSNSAIRAAADYLREGNLGAIQLVRGMSYMPRNPIGKVTGEQPIPPSIDYNLWCGPVTMRPLRRKNLHYDWHWMWETGNGDLANQGIHRMDLGYWLMGEKGLPTDLFSVGGRVGFDDDGETYNTQFVYSQFESAPFLFEVRNLPERFGADERSNYKGISSGIIVECEKGQISIGGSGGVVATEPDGTLIREFSRESGAESHYANFIRAIRSRRHEDLNAEIEKSHLATVMCHAGNISGRLGKPRPPAEIREAVQGDAAASDCFERMKEHLAANKVDIESEHLHLGVPLRMDTATERFTNNDQANAMLSRTSYRKPFGVPEKV